MVCLGFEPRAAGWKAQMNPLSYGGTHYCCERHSCFTLCFTFLSFDLIPRNPHIPCLSRSGNRLYAMVVVVVLLNIWPQTCVNYEFDVAKCPHTICQK